MKYDGHTPGPWEVCAEPKNEKWFVGLTVGEVNPDGGRRIGDVTDWGLGVTANGERMTKANAALFADAPMLLQQREELLAALKLIRYDDRLKGNEFIDENFAELIARIEATR